MTNFLSCVNWCLVGPFFVVGIAKHSPVVVSPPVRIKCTCHFLLGGRFFDPVPDVDLDQDMELDQGDRNKIQIQIRIQI
eukprot:3668413-Amphidinium_carterae.1